MTPETRAEAGAMPGRRYWDEAMETIAPAALRELEDRLVREAVRYAWDRSPFYQAKLRAAGVVPEHVAGAPDLSRVPFTSKADLRASQERQPPFGAHTAVPVRDVVRVHKTSGSTGRPLYIAMTRKDAQLTNECGARAFWAAGLRPDHVVVHCLNYCLWLGGYTDHSSLEHTGAAVVPFGVGHSGLLVRTVRDLGATAISCTPSYMAVLARVVRDELGIEPRDLGLRLGLFGGEPGMAIPGTRRAIEETWGMTARDANYGMSDTLSNFAAECHARPELHFLGQGAILCQLIDPEREHDTEMAAGESGEFVFTTLGREGQPLLRYRSGDVVRILATDPCECGRTGFRFRVLGRSDDMLIVKGVNVFPAAVENILAEMRPELTGAFQILLPRPSPLEVLSIRAEHGEATAAGQLDGLRDRVERRLREHLAVRAEVALVAPDTLPRFEGKAKRLVKLYAGETARSVRPPPP
jgi:phenylacetate-CoA ligase